MSLYRKILKQALSLTWSNKYLWFFGLFATLLGGGEYEIVNNSLGGGQEIIAGVRDFLSTNVLSVNTLITLKNFLIENPFSFATTLVMFIIFLLLLLFIIWLTIVSQAALVNNSANALAGKKHSFKEGLDSGIKNFWPVLGYNLITKILIYGIFILISLPVILSAGKVGLTSVNLFYLITFVVFTPVIISLSFIIKYAIAFKILKNESFFGAIQRGWNLFISNWLISLEMAIVLFLASFLVGLVVIILLLILAVPFAFLALALNYLTSFIGFWLIVILALIIFIAIIVLSGAVLTTFQITSWTGLFIELTGAGGTSKLIRLADNIFKK
ncbi:MAG: hypothetical protein UT48_C0011G0008 [Parcubacteria group bacterium GW2011_GWE2_39_37]|uniref:Glycerophosphoryl diester phosphodiesterase membrane domain-containing protein n=1 Tax=Candidatus Falkowbacteria bacterium GW2011_GWF2_39_8 TaxID=1618642 RepID=A0A0G0Q783_9BACT|nr:MAG: hypothetical protein UT48_C0011G0008 [Parcubacteria group bacterium GW2011_GWE2_39_37]KKR33171.1 MAG: hypothetical protein UT64_C0013G0003 [Candidatus Falkowbacteria bacterium GW2011_GWF2_39_8]